MTQTGTPFITGTLRERVVIALFSLPLAAACIWAALTGESVIRDLDSGGTATGSFGFAVFRLLCTELFAAAAAFLLLAFLWAAFQPRWARRLLLTVSRHAWLCVCLLLLSFFLLAFVVTISKYVSNKSLQRTGAARFIL
jgi:phosphoglycerol transferase MdoB-like AlkP superfamily enzyme